MTTNSKRPTLQQRQKKTTTTKLKTTRNGCKTTTTLPQRLKTERETQNNYKET